MTGNAGYVRFRVMSYIEPYSDSGREDRKRGAGFRGEVSAPMACVCGWTATSPERTLPKKIFSARIVDTGRMGFGALPKERN